MMLNIRTEKKKGHFSPSLKSKRKLLLSTMVLSLFIVLISACSPQSASDGQDKSANSGSSSSTEFAWSESSDCSTCHTAAAASFEDPACEASKHTELENDCFSCHTDKTGIAAAHASVTLDSKKINTKLKRTDVPESACLACHDKAALTADTATSTILTDAEGKTVNPHDLPQTESHADITCSSCHKMHREESVDVIAPDLCTNCHHQNVYQCNTCHD